MSLDKNRSGPAIADALLASTGMDALLDQDGIDRFRANFTVIMGGVNDELSGFLKVVSDVPGTNLVAGPNPVTGNATGTADPDGGTGSVS